jgi:multidrug efflux pump subunit AcrB
MLDATLRRGTLLAVIVLIVVVLGVLAATRVPVQMIPDLEVRTVSVQTRWPGATPQDIEQEEYLRGIPNLQRLVATANTSEATIELEFPFGVDVADALLRVSNALSEVTGYPENVDEPRLFTNSFSENSFLFFVVTALPGNPQGLDMSKMRDFVDDYVRPRFEWAPNVSEARVRDGAERQVQILVDLKALGQPFDMITMLGFLILVGTVVNNPILILDQTLTTVFGLAPLVFLPGAGTELYRGVGVIVLGGLVCSTLVTLTFLPALLVTVLEWKGRPRTGGSRPPRRTAPGDPRSAARLA